MAMQILAKFSFRTHTNITLCVKAHPVSIFLAHLWRDRVPLGAGEVISSASDLSVKLLLVFVPEGRVTHQQDVEDHTWRSEHYNPVPADCI